MIPKRSIVHVKPLGSRKPETNTRLNHDESESTVCPSQFSMEIPKTQFSVKINHIASWFKSTAVTEKPSNQY
jgi:hypothetical protein